MTNPDNVGGLPSANNPALLPGVHRLWDSQWCNIVNHDDCYRDYTKEEAVAMAVRLTEKKMAENAELCRAAPAGGELTENERRRAATFKIPQVGWACVSRQQSLPEPADCDWPMCGCDPYADKVIEALQEDGVIRDHSAPAGSGDVEKLVRSARAIIDHAVHGEPVSLQDAHDKLTEAAALLRKLQQGADGWRPIESAPKGDRRVVLLVSNNGPNGYITDPWTGWVNSDGSFARWPHRFPPTHWMAISPKYPARAASQDQEGSNG